MPTLAVVLIAVFSFVFPSHAQAPTTEPWQAELSEAKGTVTVYTAENPDGVPGDAGLPLQEGDRVTTGADGSAEVALDGGSLLALSANSDFTLTNLHRAESIFQLAAGSLYAKIASLLPSHSLQVRTPTAVAAVRGTEFGVEVPVDDPKATHVGVFDEGKVEVRGQSGGPETLIANQETQVQAGGAPLPPYQLRRLMRRRAFVRFLRRRAALRARAWRSLPPDKRRELRRQFIERLRERRRLLREKRELGPGRGERLKDRPDRKRMEKFREEIRRRRESGGE